MDVVRREIRRGFEGASRRGVAPRRRARTPREAGICAVLPNSGSNPAPLPSGEPGAALHDRFAQPSAAVAGRSRLSLHLRRAKRLPQSPSAALIPVSTSPRLCSSSNAPRRSGCRSAQSRRRADSALPSDPAASRVGRPASRLGSRSSSDRRLRYRGRTVYAGVLLF